MDLALAFGGSSAGVGGGRVLCLPPCPSVSPSPYLIFTKNGRLSLKAAADTRSRRVLDKGTFTLSRAQNKEAHVHADNRDGDEEEDDDEYEYEYEYEDEDEDDRETREWKANRPAGFGHGKTYDTSLEDKLLAEFEQSRKANSNTEKHARKVKDEKQHKEPTRHKALESIPDGVNVRIGNLPKKKNIARDLQASFKGYPGLLHINPIESGNKKTREPVCKGLAFLTFKNDDVANRFVTRFNGESVVFGKIEKKISCCLASPSDLRNSGFVAENFTSADTLPRLRIREKRTEYMEGLIDSAIFLHQQKENHAKFSMKLGSEHMNGKNEANNSVRSGFGSIVQNDGLDSSDTRPSWRDLKTDSHTNSLNDNTLMAVDAEEFYDHNGITETSIANIQDDSHKDPIEAKKQKKKKQKEHKSKSPIEANSSDSTAVLHGSANRLKKKGKNVLSAVLVKYGKHAGSTKS